jgi:hypothetical protein
MQGGDKAPVARKAEAKARGNSPFFFYVDESRFNRSGCLTAFGRNRAAGRPLHETLQEFRENFSRIGLNLVPACAYPS